MFAKRDVRYVEKISHVRFFIITYNSLVYEHVLDYNYSLTMLMSHQRLTQNCKIIYVYIFCPLVDRLVKVVVMRAQSRSHTQGSIERETMRLFFCIHIL